MNGVRLPENLRNRFEDLSADNEALKAKYANFCQAIHDEQKMLTIVAKDLWTQTIFELGLEGEWRYENGMVYPKEQ
jgi:hypothetical protein